MTRPLQVYVWADVFSDYTSGGAMAVARSLPVAIDRAVAAEQHLGSQQRVREVLERTTPRVYRADSHEAAIVVWGGG